MFKDTEKLRIANCQPLVLSKVTLLSPTVALQQVIKQLNHLI